MAGEEIKVLDTSTGAVQSSGSSVSLLNAFYVFKYSGGVEKITAENYTSNTITRHGAAPKVISNPTAQAIVEWSKGLPATTENVYGLKDSPYTWSDFLFCKWYGIIPNNRLVTLRKFPLATNDAASVNRTGGAVQNIPVAQAVTWFGGPSGNDLNSMWQSSWNLEWTKKSVDPKNVQGNEITNFSQQLVNALPAGTNEFVKLAISNLGAQADIQASKNGTGDLRKDYLLSIGKGTLETKKQEFIKNLFADNGAFWNQINGPVNVKNQFLIRDRGLSNKAVDDTWKISFEYKTNSYFGMNQRRIALDIIANMLELTYSSGEWMQSLNIYYKNVGIELGKDEQALIESAFTNGTLDPEALAKRFVEIAETRVDGILAKAIELGTGAVKATGTAIWEGAKSVVGAGNFDLTKNLSDEQKSTMRNAIQIQLVQALAGAFPGFIQQRASVADIPTGNWHLTIGNPMNPIMRIGNLVVRSCSLTFGDELGPDDFPIDMKFDVTVSPTKPRDARDIRRTFNTGRADYVETYVGHTFDQSNSYGRINTMQTALSSGNGGASSTSTQTVALNENQNRIKTWLNDRYGAGVVNDQYFTDVYFYVPKDTETYGPDNSPKK